MSVKVSATPIYDMLVGVNERGTYPDKDSLGINNKDVKLRRRFQQQQIMSLATGSVISTLPICTLNDNFAVQQNVGNFTVSSNDFSGGAQIQVGKFVLNSDVDFVVGGSVAATATNISTAIGNLPGFTSTTGGGGGEVVIVFAAPGLQGMRQTFKVINFGTVDNFTAISPALGTFAYDNVSLGVSGIEPPIIT